MAPKRECGPEMANAPQKTGLLVPYTIFDGNHVWERETDDVARYGDGVVS